MSLEAEISRIKVTTTLTSHNFARMLSEGLERSWRIKRGDYTYAQ